MSLGRTDGRAEKMMKRCKKWIFFKLRDPILWLLTTSVIFPRWPGYLRENPSSSSSSRKKSFTWAVFHRRNPFCVPVVARAHHRSIEVGGREHFRDDLIRKFYSPHARKKQRSISSDSARCSGKSPYNSTAEPRSRAHPHKPWEDQAQQQTNGASNGVNRRWVNPLITPSSRPIVRRRRQHHSSSRPRGSREELVSSDFHDQRLVSDYSFDIRPPIIPVVPASPILMPNPNLNNLLSQWTTIKLDESLIKSMKNPKSTAID